MSRQKMYDTNKRVRDYLLQVDACTDVWMKSHTRRHDKTWTFSSFYLSKDLFNLFDGIALTNRKIILFQAKTTNFPVTEPLNLFANRFQGVTVAAYVARKIKGRIQVLKRVYPHVHE